MARGADDACPGIAAAWLWVAPRGRLAAPRQLLAGGAAMVGRRRCAWPLLVTLTPAANRPWISGTSDNSIWSLIFGYNGLGRLDGQAGGPAGARRRRGGCSAARPVRCGCSTPRSAGRPAGCSASRWSAAIGVDRGHAAAPRRRPHRLADRHGRRLPHVRGGVQLRQGHLPPLLRVAARAVHARRWSARRPRRCSRAITLGRIVGALAIAGGVVTELIVLHNIRGQLGWLPPLLVGGGVRGARWRSRGGLRAARGWRCWPRCWRCWSSRRPPGRSRRSATPPAAPSRPAGRPRPPRWAAPGASAARGGPQGGLPGAPAGGSAGGAQPGPAPARHAGRLRRRPAARRPRLPERLDGRSLRLRLRPAAAVAEVAARSAATPPS